MRIPLGGVGTKGPGPIPSSALVLSLSALAVPVFSATASPEFGMDYSAVLVWMTPLLPGFLLAYHRGRRGATLALATGMASLASTQVAFLLTGADPPSWWQLFGVVVAYLLFALGLGIMAEVLKKERDAAREMALTDPLTDLPNRRHAELFLDTAFARAERGSSLAVALIDLDHFKEVNDRFGHAAGDEVLASVGGALGRSTRKSDLTARVGGEEFLSILTTTDASGAQVFARRVREEIRSLEFPWGRVTASVGVTWYHPRMETVEDLLGSADAALYRAKAMGRDHVSVDPGMEGIQRHQAHDHLEDGGSLEFSSLRPTLPSFRVAVVEDDPAVARALGRVFERSNCRVSVFLDPRDIIARLDEGGPSPDLLLTDIMMPAMTGPQLVEEMSRRGLEPPVIYLSGYNWVEKAGFLPRERDSVFLEKPVTLETLRFTALSLLGPPEHTDETLTPAPQTTDRRRA